MAWVSKACVFVAEEGEDGEGGREGFRTICAFCFRTSAGVRMRQETSSPVDEARAWRTGVGIRGAVEEGRVGFRVWRRDLVDS